MLTIGPGRSFGAITLEIVVYRTAEDGDIALPGKKRKTIFESYLMADPGESNFACIANDQPEMRRHA